MISVVIPVYGNADALTELHGRLHHALARLSTPFEIVFVDDASVDASPEVLRRLAGIDDRVVVRTLPENRGQQRAVLTGLGCARGTTVVVIDADLQDPPEAIPSLIAALDGHVSAAFLGRRGRHQRTGRLVTSRLFKTLLNWCCGTPIDAGLCVAMDRRMVSRLIDFDPPGPMVLAMMGSTGLPLMSVPWRRDFRRHGRSTYSHWSRAVLGFRAIAWTLERRWRVAGPRP